MWRLRSSRLSTNVLARRHLSHIPVTPLASLLPSKARQRMNDMADTCDPKAPEVKVDELPKLSAAEFRTYNRMAEHMDYFHNHFRRNWTIMYNAATSGKRPQGMSIKQFLNMIEGFCSSLTTHHGIEEMHIFPILARKMPAFQRELELLTQHKQIHAGIDRLEDFVSKCRTGETDFRMEELRSIMDSFGEVLWQHLDAEVKELGAANMRKYWTIQEMQRMPM